MKKPIIEYPCEWSYRIIGTDKAHLKKAAAMCLGKAEYRLSMSNTSRRGTYISLNIETIVPDEKARNQIHVLLANHPSVKMVL